MRLDVDSLKLHHENKQVVHHCKMGEQSRLWGYMLSKVSVLSIVSESAFTLVGSEGRVVGVHRIPASSKKRG
jgi:hypothetical protein